jgi:mannose/fructose/N-acetylgalactosamine-specific phosphotransferase system component IIC
MGPLLARGSESLVIRHALIAAFWGGVIALDITGFGPWLIAQPMVAGPLFGWLMGGQVATGVIIGGVVQLLWMDITPVGVGIPYDAMAVTLLAIFWSTLTAPASLSKVVLALILAVPFGSVFKMMDQWARRLNTRILHHMETVKDEYLSVALSAAITAGLVWSFLRYAISYFIAMLMGAWLWGKIGYFAKLPSVDRGLAMAAILLPLAGMSITLDLFLSEEPDTRWLARLGFKGSGKQKSKS